jgi:inorganic pyrophosphatase
MNEDTSGLSRALVKGGRVIMSNGATAIALAAYPANYTGNVRLLLDGQEVADEAESLVLPGSEDGRETIGESESPIAGGGDGGEARGRSHRMED